MKQEFTCNQTQNMVQSASNWRITLKTESQTTNHQSITKGGQPVLSPNRNPDPSGTTKSQIPTCREKIRHPESEFQPLTPSYPNRPFTPNIPLQLSSALYKSTLFPQNKPNPKNYRITANPWATKNYEENDSRPARKNKPNQTQSRPANKTTYEIRHTIYETKNIDEPIYL